MVVSCLPLMEFLMDESVKCIRCQARMECGYLPDGGDTNLLFRHWWAAGTYKLDCWKHPKVSRDQLVPVTTYRCPNCGYLESYAMQEKPTETLPTAAYESKSAIGGTKP